jgi:hypothetical protein
VPEAIWSASARRRFGCAVLKPERKTFSTLLALHREAKAGSSKAVTAMANKLPRVLWHLLKYEQPFDWNVFAKEEEKIKRKKLARLRNLAASMNFQLTPLT